MEEQLLESPQLGYPTADNDVKYVSGLSTALVATIQDAKERISQIEYIFCSQLSPHFQSNPEILQKIYLEARKAAEVEWKEKENELLHQIEKLEKQQTLEKKSQSLKLESMGQLLSELNMQVKLLQKSNESDFEMEQLSDYISLTESETLKYKEQLEKCEKEKDLLLVKVKSLEKKVNGLQVELKRRTNEVIEGKALYESTNSELLAEKKKLMSVVDAYKKLRSHYNFLSKKLGLTEESMLSENKLGDETDTLKHNKNHITSPGVEDKIQATCNKVEREITPDNLECPKSYPVADEKKRIKIHP